MKSLSSLDQMHCLKKIILKNDFTKISFVSQTYQTILVYILFVIKSKQTKI